jgi:HAMP domain-containing protein
LDADQVITMMIPEPIFFHQVKIASSRDNFALVQTVIQGDVALASLATESLFYGVLGTCGVVLALRAVISIMRVLREERLLKARRSAVGISSPLSRKATPSLPTSAPLESGELDAQKKTGILKSSGFWFELPSGLRQWLRLYIHGITGKLSFIFVGIIGVFGLVTVAVIYFNLSFSLSRQVIQTARITALNVGLDAPGYLSKNNATGLRALLRRHANTAELDYIVVEDRAGKIFAHSFDVIPRAVRGSSSSGAHAIESQSTVRLGDRVAYEISVPISEGRDGAVRVGIWREQVDAKISETVIPLINLVVLVLSGGALMAIFLVWQITRPIRRLVAAAKAISSGDLDTPSPQVEDSNEFGELSRAIERMRSSVKAAMVRLSR